MWLTLVLLTANLGSFSYFFHGIIAEKADDKCQSPLGIQSGGIPNSSFLANQAYNNDMGNFGPQYARLMSPKGYRGSKRLPADSWLSVTFESTMVVTAIATQGYGNATVQEWVTHFSLMYSKGGRDFRPVRDATNETAIFSGNKDSNTIKTIILPFPVKAIAIMFFPNKWHNNVGLRMELYGCKTDFYLTSQFLMAGQPYTTKINDEKGFEFNVAKEEAVLEMARIQQTIPGFLEFKFKGFRPQESTISGQVVIEVEFDIYCIESNLQFIITKLIERIRYSDVFEAEYLQLKYPNSRLCPTPQLKILPSNLRSERLTILSGAGYVFKTEFNNNCTTKRQRLLVEWKTGIIHEPSGYISPLVPQSKQNWNFSITTFSAPLIFLQCTVQISVGNEDSYIQDYKFVRVIDSKLTAIVKGPNLTVLGSSNVTLDGGQSTASGDPQFLKDLVIKFNWNCTFSSNEGLQQGCFGKSRYDPFSSDKLLTLNINDMAPGVYDFILDVSSGKVKDKIWHRLTVLPYTSLSLKCISNCLVKTNPSKKQVISSMCHGAGCSNIQNYTWIFYLFDRKNNNWKPLLQPANSTSTVDKGATLIVSNFTHILGFVSFVDEKFKLKVLGHINEFVHIEAEREFILNAVPESSNSTDCYVTPKEGLAMDTYFNVSCENWKDEDVPLHFNFQYFSTFGLIILQSGLLPKISTQLLPGQNATKYSYDIIVIVSDRYGASQTRYLTVKVMVPSKNEANKKISKLDNELKDLETTGDSSKAADISLFTLCLLEIYDSQEDFQIQAKKDIVKRMSNFNFTSIETTAKCVALIKPSTDQPRKLSTETQENALKLIEKISVAMTAEAASNTTSGLTQENTGNFADSIIHGLSNVMDPELDKHQVTSSDRHKVDSTPQRDKTHDGQRGTITQRTLGLVKKIANTVSSFSNAGDGPTIIKSKNIAVRVEKDVPSSFDKKIIQDNEGIVQLPPLKDVLLNSNKTINIMGCQVIEYKRNPFNWHRSSKAVETGTIDISLQNNGRKMTINYLRNPVNLYLPKNSTIPKITKTQKEFFLTPVETISQLNTTKNMNYHSMYIPSEYLTVNIHIVPEKTHSFEIFIKPKEKPTPLNFSYFVNVPDLSVCTNQTTRSLNIANCIRDPYTIQINSSSTGKTGLHFIGIRALPNQSKKATPIQGRRQTRSDPKIGSQFEKQSRFAFSDEGSFHERKQKRQKRSCIEIKDPITSPPKLDLPVYNNKTDIKYKFNTFLSACLFWSEEKQQWNSRGCKLGSNSNGSHVHCLCNHMTAFGGDFFVAPNPINFDYILKEFSRIDETGNFVVMTTVIAMWSAYLVGLVFARRADIQDKRKIINCTINGNHQGTKPKVTYKISIQTGVWLGSGTTASVALILHGIKSSIPIYFNNTDPKRQLFARGSVNSYWISIPEDLGDIYKIKIWHNNAGKDPSWFLYDIVINEEDGEKSWSFLINKWIAVERGGVEAEAFQTDEKEQKKLKNRFYSRAARQFSNAHLWLSVFTKSVHSPFTRCQRLSSCFLVLTSTMVTNAMFYRFASPPTETFMIGPFKVSLTSIKTGVQSALIILPINVLVAFVFEKVKSKRTVVDSVVVLHEEETHGFIPRFMIPVAWFLCVSGSLVSSTFTIFYSLMWGTEIANQWLISTVISFAHDVLVNQPIKIIILVSLLAMLIKKPIDNRENVTDSIKRDNIDGYKVDPPKESSLKEWRDKLVAKLTAKKFLGEITVYGALVMLVFIVCYGSIETDRFHQTSSIKLIAKEFHEVKSSSTFWDWLNNYGIPFLYDITWYNGKLFNGSEGYISSKKTFLIGMPRLRQLRVKSDSSCIEKIPTTYRNLIIVKTCLPQYNILKEDNTLYSLPGWRPLPANTSTSMQNQFDRLCPRSWSYSNFKTIQSLPYMSQGTLYGGGGYVADLGYNKSSALLIAGHLESNGWIDDHTAAVFVEFTLFSPTTMLFSSVKLLFEKLPYGAAITYERIDTFKVYSKHDKTFLQACQFLLMIMIIVIIGMELQSLLIERTRYFKNFWNILQWFQVGTVVAAIVISYIKESYTSTFLKRIEENPFKTSSSDYIVMWSDLETLLLSIVIFILTIKLLRIIRFNRFISDLIIGLKSAKDMAGPLIVLFIIVMAALTSMSNLLFGDSSYDFSTYTRSLGKMVQLLAGGKLFKKETSFAESSFGLFFGVLYTTTTTVFLVNVFVSVLIESMKEFHDKRTEDDVIDPMREIRSWSNKLFHRKRKGKDKRKYTADNYEVLPINGVTRNNVARNGKIQTVVLYDMNNGSSFLETRL